jgi:hypothetical protein
MSGGLSVDVTDNDSVLIYEDSAIQKLLTSDVSSMRSAYEFTANLDVVIVLQNRFMRVNGLSLDTISRENLSEMPYYIVLKVHSGYQSLNSQMTRLINKHLKKKNSFFGQVYRIEADVNLKSA